MVRLGKGTDSKLFFARFYSTIVREGGGRAIKLYIQKIIKSLQETQVETKMATGSGETRSRCSELYAQQPRPLTVTGSVLISVYRINTPSTSGPHSPYKFLTQQR